MCARVYTALKTVLSHVRAYSMGAIPGITSVCVKNISRTNCIQSFFRTEFHLCDIRRRREIDCYRATAAVVLFRLLYQLVYDCCGKPTTANDDVVSPEPKMFADNEDSAFPTRNTGHVFFDGDGDIVNRQVTTTPSQRVLSTAVF